MTTIVVLLCIVLLLLIVVQIARVKELAAKLRGEEEVERRSTQSVGISLVFFMVAFLVITAVSAYYYKNYMLGYGPHESASQYGKLIDSAFNWTLLATYPVFVLTHIALFWYSYKYRFNRNRKAEFISHNNTLELVWMGVPAIVMTLLVLGGLDSWNTIMADVGTDEEILEVEATGSQFVWELRYPGEDAYLGRKNFRLIGGVNSLGLDFTDEKSHDDFIAQDLVLPVGQKVRVRITAKDVLHDFYLPQFRVKMDAVPGLPTYFVFTPEKTTEEYRQELRKYAEYNVPDPDEPEKMLWETFEYELACAELCGTGHWNMKKKVSVVSQEEFNDWYAKQQSFYFTQVRGTDLDPYKDADDFLPYEVSQIKKEFNSLAAAALETEDTADDTFVLEYVFFKTASAELSNRSKYQLEEAAKWIAANPSVNVDLSGYTDATGDTAANQLLSEQRADAVRNFLVAAGVAAERLQARGFGSSQPRDTNETEQGRAANRRTEFTIKQTRTPL